ncbi:hypothetical protein ACTXT7_009546 [Hymenolepis weldensis]
MNVVMHPLRATDVKYDKVDFGNETEIGNRPSTVPKFLLPAPTHLGQVGPMRNDEEAFHAPPSGHLNQTPCGPLEYVWVDNSKYFKKEQNEGE